MHLLASLFVILLFLPSLAQTQTQALTPQAILQSAWQSDTYEGKQRELDFLQDARLQIPLLEELEFRTETRDFDLNRQEYAFRLKFNSPRQRQVQTAVNNTEVNLRELALNEELEQQLYERYQLLLDIHLAQQQRQQLDQQAAWFEDQETVLRRQLELEGEEKLDDWLKLEDDRFAYAQRRIQNQERLRLLQVNLQNLLSSEAVSDLPDVALLPVAAIRTKLATNKNSTAGLPIQIQAQALEVELLNLEARGELTEQRNLLQFLQLRYQNDDEPIFREQFSLGVGIRLPFRNASSVKQQYLMLERLEEENKQAAFLREWNTELSDARARLTSATEVYNSLAAALSDYQAQYDPFQLRDQGVTDVQLLLRAQGGIYQRQQLVLRQRAEVYQSYLDLLLVTGRLSQAPYRNWWSEQEEMLRE